MPQMTRDELSILAKIERSLAGISAKNGDLALGIGDDAALFRPKTGYETILTCDWFLEGAHFLRNKQPPDSVGWKCLARAVSDIAAMGGTPRYFLLSLALPDSITGIWLTRFLGGLRRASQKFGCALAAGNTPRQSKILINVTVVGEVRKGRATLRRGAQPGDLIYVSGALGEAELGLHTLRRTKGIARSSNAALRKDLYPEPRIALGRWLVQNRIVTAMMDLSDGLSSDLRRLCAASGVGATIDAPDLPLAKSSISEGRRENLFELALHGGDDYELLFTTSRTNAARIPRRFQGVPLTPIGE